MLIVHNHKCLFLFNVLFSPLSVCNSYNLQASVWALLGEQNAWTLAKQNKIHAVKFCLTAENEITTAE